MDTELEITDNFNLLYEYNKIMLFSSMARELKRQPEQHSC